MRLCQQLNVVTSGIILIALALLPTDAIAQDLYAPANGFWIAPAQRPLKLYGPTSADARWFIAQWGNPDPLGAFQQVPGKAMTYRAESASAAVTVRKGTDGTDYTFSQNGGNLPCQGPNGSPKEFDLLAQVITPAVAPDLPSADLMSSAGGKPPSLQSLSSLRMSTNLAIGRSWAPPDTDACSNNAVNVTTAIVLRDDAMVPPQVLYYQLSLYEYCAPGPKLDACLGSKSKQFFWWNGITDHSNGAAIRKRYGYRDALASYDAPTPVPGKTTRITIDLKPRLTELLSDASNGLDSNPQHWTITGAYHGQILLGKAGLETTWSGFSLSSGPPRTNR